MFVLYKRTNKITGKSYIGQTSVKPVERWKREFKESRYLGRALRKYGENNFENEILEQYEDQDTANFREQCLIAEHGTLVPWGYNLQTGGRSHRQHAETRKKISEKSKGVLNKMFGRSQSQYQKDKVRLIMLGNNHFLGKTQSVHQKKVASLIHLGNKNFLGRKHSSETNKKMSAVASGEKNHFAKLTWNQVKEIRKKYIPIRGKQAELAQEYRLSSSCISNIVTNKIWKEGDCHGSHQILFN